MAIHDIPASTAVRMYDFLQQKAPRRCEQLRNEVRTRHGALKERAVRQRVIGLWLRGDVTRYRGALRGMSVPMPEPMQSSPIEQIKGLTSFLNPNGEQTGGNFRAGF